MLKKILSLSLILLTLSLFFRSDALAKPPTANFKLGRDVIVGKDEIIEGPYLKVGDNIAIRGTINGDAFVAGSFVTVDGTINGDLIVAGGIVTVKGRISDDIRAAGGMVTIDGKVGKNATIFGGTVTLGSDTDINEDMLVFAKKTFVHLGNIDGQALIRADKATLAGRIGGDAKAQVSKLSVPKTALLDGNLSYTSDREASVSAQAKIAGRVQRLPAGKALTRLMPRPRRGFLRFRLLSYLSTLLLGLLLLKIAPRQVTAVSRLIGEQPWRSLGLGFLALVLIPVAIVILMISVIGVPLAAILTGIYLLMILLSSIFSGLFVGKKFFALTNLKENPYAMMAIGLLLLQLIFAVPVVGSFARILSLLAAIGAMLILKREALKRLEVRSGEGGN